jgi:glutamine amidotransferase
MASVALIDYGSGNLRSVEKALARAAAEGGTGLTVNLTSKAEDVAEAERIVLPGVGAFASCMNGLSALPGMIEALNEAVHKKTKPFFGICVGMQLLARVGHEFGDTPGLDWIDGEVGKLDLSDASLKIPHMGWNELKVLKSHPILDGLAPATNVYFVHSYAMRVDANARQEIVATTDYGGEIVAAVAKDNIAGTQFHPEKSQEVGQAILRNFLKWKP